MSIIEEYWTGVLQRLEAEVAVLAKLIVHQGERGRENEAALARVLESFVPRRYGVGTGLMIDNTGRYSRQTDIVVYEQSDEPAVLAQTTQLLFPVENVLAAIEVKTTLRAEDIRDAFDKRESMRSLEPTRDHSDGSSHPLFVVLAYTADARPETVAAHLREATDQQRPELVCVLEQALLLGRPGVLLSAPEESLGGGLALLRDDDGNWIKGEPAGPEMRQAHNGRLYPIVPYDGSMYLADPGRALLLLVEALVRLAASSQGRPAPILTDYLPPASRELAWL